MQTSNLMDFRGGYFTDYTSELMANNELLTAVNCNWRNGMVKRNGKDHYDTGGIGLTQGLKGAVRAYINDTWTTILAVEVGGVVNFYSGTGTTFAVIDASYDWQAGYEVEFGEIEGQVVATNGYNKPAVIYYDGGLVVENLETYDTRTWEDTNIYGGQWDDSETPPWIEDNAAAADGETGSANFEVSSGTNNDGFYASCDYPFNKVTVKGFVNNGAATPEYHYWDGSAWVAISLLASVDWSTSGDKMMEWDIPLDADKVLDMKPYAEEDALDIENLKLSGRFVIRVRFTSAPAGGAANADYLVIEHTQYLTQILFDEKPHTVYVHNGTMFLASRWIINFSPYQSVKGWREYQTDFFEEAGARIMQMISYQDVMVVLTEGALFTYNTTSLTDPIRSRPLANVGAKSGRSAAVVGNLLFFCSEDGIYVWDGSNANKCSKHIQSDIDSWELSNCAGVHYKNEYLICFPDESIVLVCDPDTVRRDSMGDVVISFYKYTNWKAHHFMWCRGWEDTGYLLGIIDRAYPYIDRFDVGSQDDSDNITMTLKTRFYNWTGFQDHKYMGRLKPKMREVSAVTGATHTLNFYSDEGKKMATKTLSVPVGDGYFEDTISLPYTMDGKNVSFEFIHSGPTSACLIGYAVQLRKRRF